MLSTWGTLPWPSLNFVDWRETAGILKQRTYAEDTPIFFNSGFIEAKSEEWLKDEVRLGFVLAPVHIYPIPGAIAALPYEPNTSLVNYMANITRGLASHREFFVVDRDRDDSWQNWFRSRYSQTFSTETLRSGRGALVTRFYRRDSH